MKLPTQPRPPSTQQRSAPRQQTSKGRLARLSGFFRREQNSFYTYGLVTLGLYVYLAQQCARNQEEVPITGRRRYAGTPSQDADLRKAIVQLAARISAGEELLPMTKTVLHADDPLTRKFQKIFDALLFGVGLCNRSLKVYVIDQPELSNAFAVPTGHIYVTTALLFETESNDEIAAILSHELAHLTAEHGREIWHRRRVEARLTIPSLLPHGLVALVLRRGRVLLACVAAQILVAAVPLTFLNLRASRQREREADYIGLLIMAQAGFDPAAAVVCMEREHSRMNELVRQLQQQYGSDKIDVPKEWQTTHPLPASRMRAMHELIPMVREIVSWSDQSDGNKNHATPDPSTLSGHLRWREFLASQRGTSFTTARS
ncbi:hypothetical protein LTR27_005760 [Elasticomyces elasticus]|nr:hypothetical protein LTR27_005760 [Elasticomyces elasticus]